MQITGKTRIYKNQYGYSVADNQKDKDGNWTNYFIPVQFPNNVTPPNDKEDIVIFGFTKPYKYRDGKVGISYVITQWEPQKKDEPAKETEELDLEATFGQAVEIEVNEDDLPF